VLTGEDIPAANKLVEKTNVFLAESPPAAGRSQGKGNQCGGGRLHRGGREVVVKKKRIKKLREGRT